MAFCPLLIISSCKEPLKSKEKIKELVQRHTLKNVSKYSLSVLISSALCKLTISRQSAREGMRNRWKIKLYVTVHHPITATSENEILSGYGYNTHTKEAMT